MSAPRICPLIIRFCKRGHLRTKESTFERKVHVSGKDYITRECRVCHAMRNNRTKKPWTKFQSKSKWSEARAAGSSCVNISKPKVASPLSGDGE